MKYELCIACDHSDPSRTNDRQQIFCEINPPYVDRFNGCDEFENKALYECFKIIGNSKLTDNEIIKALECCSIASPIADREVTMCGIPSHIVCKNAFDLINRQQAEIERLKEHKLLIANVEVPKDKFERLINKNVAAIYDEADVIFSCYEHIRAEAIKEFAERLKKDFGHGVLGMDSVAAIIDNLVKEMVGDSNAE